MFQNKCEMMEKERIEKLISIALATAAPIFPNGTIGLGTSSQNTWIQETHIQSQKSGPMMVFFPHSSKDYQVMNSTESPIDKVSQEIQRRYQSILQSFGNYNKAFPLEKQSYLFQMANELSKLEFNDDVSSYNDLDASIDSVLKLANGLTLSVSCFIEDDIEAPMVFSIHRGRELLVSDELPIDEIVSTINSVIV